MPLTPKQFLEQDDALNAKKAAESLPEGHPDRTGVAQHLDHLASPEAYREYYQTMRGGVCPEAEVFTRHKFVTRFATIRRLILERKQKTVLDLGCLDGWQLLNLAASGVTGVGVDLCPEALSIGRERAKKWGFSLWFAESSIENFVLEWEHVNKETGEWSSFRGPNTFDAVILSEVLEHVLDPATCFRTAVRHLAKDGTLYVSVPATPIPHHGKLEDAREHLRIFSEADLRALATEAGLAVVEDHELIDSKDGEEAYTNRTISFRRAKITVYCNHVTGGWRPDQLDDTGASEEMVVKTAEAWVRAGHAITVHQNGYDGVLNGVAYLPRTIAPEPDRDLLVLFKTLEYADRPAGTRIFWTTDFPQPGQAASFLPPRLVDSLDAVVCISEYHRQELLKACAWLSPEKTKAHWLGVERELIENYCDHYPKVRGRVIYASSLDRGLSQLLAVWPRILEAVPDATLNVLYGFDFWIKSESVLPASQAAEMCKERVRLTELLSTLPGVTFYRRVSRDLVLQEFAEAEVWAYPCTGGELCCKTALEAQAARCLPVVVPTMALTETVQVGIKTNQESFETALTTALTEPLPVPKWDTVHLPSWDDLSRFLWGLRKEGLCLIAHDKQEPVSLPTDTGTLAPVPMVFDRPRRITVPVTGLDIIMAVRGMPFDGNTDREKNLGGSETAAAQLSRELVKRGHRVSVFSNLPGQPGKFDGVNYLPVEEWGRYAASTCHDVSIVQRDPMAFNQPLRSKVNVLWCHDLGLQRYRGTFRPSLWNVDHVVPVSHWHGRQLAAVYDLPSSLIIPMRNGVDAEMLQRIVGKGQVRDRKALVYASRPERGLDVLLQSVFPRLLERDSELTLYIAGYENTTEPLREFYSHCVVGDTLVDMPRDYRANPYGVSISSLVGKSNFPVYCYDSTTHKMTLGTVKWVKRTRCQAPIYKLTLDDGQILKATGDHPIMLRDESWKRLDELKPGDSLMPLYKTARVLVNLNNGKYETEHRMVAEWKKGGTLDKEKEHAHHVNGDTWNNSWENIQPLDASSHARKTRTGRKRDPLAEARRVAAYKRWSATPEAKAARSIQSRKTAIARWVGMSAEQRTSFADGQRDRYWEWYNKLSGLEKTRHLALLRRAGDKGRRNNNHQSARVKAWWADLSPVYREEFVAARAKRVYEGRWNHSVVSVEPAGKADVYDMEVEKHHNFVANGIVVHNCQRLIANFGPRAKWMGYLKKPDLYNLYSRAGCYAYPSRSFEEVACISAMEAAACGLPFVGTTLGALPETTGLIPGFAQLVPHPGNDATEEFIGAFVEACWNTLTDEIKNKTMSNAGRNGAKAFSWEGVAEEWGDFLLGSLEQRSRNGQRVARQWWRLGDLNGLQTLSEEDRAILTPTQQKAVFDAEPDEPVAVPAHVIQAVIQAALEVGAKTVGSLTRSNDPNLAEAVVASGLTFMNAGPVDFRVGIETLDCSEDPVEHIQWAETTVNQGGHVCMILAAPGTHQDRLVRGLPRKRRWVFDNHDARELLGGKRDLLVGAIGGGSVSAYDHSLLTWSLYSWAPSGINDPSAKIDLVRRRWLQAPSPTLSACMIVKDAENMLHRCLKSIEPYCDEIIVDDTGSTDSTRAILAQHGIEPAAGLNPLDVGFDEARNEGLRRTTGDMVLWIDADEELLDGFQLPKYLRWSMYDGFGISQHHFSAVPPNAFKPDLPVRVFRRTNMDGSPTGIRWWGFVHEHPEKAINESVGQSVVLSDVHIAHEGYLSETIRRRRFNRNIPLMFRDRLKYPQRVLGKFLMIRDWCHLARYQMEQTGGQLTPEGAHYLEAAVEAYRKDFLGLTHAMAADGLQYYNEALQMLGRGFEVQLVLKVGGLDGAPHEVNYAGRVASAEDLERLVLSGTRDLTGIWKGKYL